MTAALSGPAVRRYLVLSAAEYRRYSRYRAATVAGIVSHCVFALIRAAAFTAAIDAAGGTIRGYDRDQAVNFAWLSQALIVTVGMYGWAEIAERVRTGDIAVELLRPMGLLTSFWARDLGRAAYTLPTRGLPVLVLGVAVVGVRLPVDWRAYALGAVSVVLAVSICYACRFAINLVAFWTIDAGGYMALYIIVLDLFSGFYLPVHVFPGWLQAVSHALPFASMLQTPIDVLSGRATGTAALALVGVQVFWLVVTLGIARGLLGLASRRLHVQGG